MKFVLAVAIALLFSGSLPAQSADQKLRSDLQTLHAKWFKAYDSGDGATMDQVEASNLILVMPDGTVFTKKTKRAGTVSKPVAQVERSLGDVTVRQFGDAAVLTGILTSVSGEDSKREATTVVFVQQSGQWKVASAQWTTVTPPK